MDLVEAHRSDPSGLLDQTNGETIWTDKMLQEEMKKKIS